VGAEEAEEVSVQGRRDTTRTNLNILDLASILQSLSMNRRTGTLKVTAEGGESALLYIREGMIRLASASTSDISLLEEAMIKYRHMTREDLAEARESCKAAGQSLAQFLAAQERLEERELKALVTPLIVERGTEALSWQDVHCEFFPDRVLEPDLDPELADFLFPTPVDGVLLEAARRADEWERIHKAFDPAREVFELVRELPEHLAQPAEREIASLLDGNRDVSEVVELSSLSQFATCEVLLEMVNNGHIRALNAGQLAELGGGAAAQGDWAKALRLYQRAYALDRKRPDLPMRLAAAYQALGDFDSARAHLLAFVKTCMSSSHFAVAARACERLVAIDPEEPEHRAKLFRCLLETDSKDELAAVGRELFELYEKRGVLDRATEIVGKLRGLFPDDADLAEMDARIRLATAERTEALIEYEKLADSYLAKGELESAIRTFRRILEEIDEECLEARLQMAECLIQLERIDEAVAEYTKLADILMRTGVFDESINLPFVLKVHRRVAELDPVNTSSREWLAESYARRGDRDGAVTQFDELLSIYQDEGRHDRLIATLQRIADLFPDVLNYREWLAECYLAEEGGQGKARNELKALLRAAWQQEDFETGVRTAERLLTMDPFYMEAHVLLGESLLGKGEREAAIEKMLSVAMMYMGAGQLSESEEVLKELLEHDDENADVHRFMAAVLEERGAKEGAARHYRRAGLLSLDHGNYGSAHVYLGLARELGGPDDEVEEAMGRAERKLTED
jgi:tetratricopeptide (TPR) repeat protein